MLAKTASTILLVALLSACASTTEKGSGNPDLERLIEDAEEAIDKAASIGGEWRDSRTILDKAREAGQRGELEQATKLAEQAKKQGEMGYQQAQEQKISASPWLF